MSKTFGVSGTNSSPEQRPLRDVYSKRPEFVEISPWTLAGTLHSDAAWIPTNSTVPGITWPPSKTVHPRNHELFASLLSTLVDKYSLVFYVPTLWV